MDISWKNCQLYIYIYIWMRTNVVQMRNIVLLKLKYTSKHVNDVFVQTLPLSFKYTALCV